MSYTTPGDLLKKSETDLNRRIFLELIMFLRQKIDKTGTESK